MRLSYEDLASLLGKEKSTIRSQINMIKQKEERIIEETVEKNGEPMGLDLFVAGLCVCGRPGADGHGLNV